MEDNNIIEELQNRLEFARKLIAEKDEEIEKLKEQSSQQLIEAIATPLTRLVNLGYDLPDGKTRQDFIETWDLFKSQLISCGITPQYHARGEVANASSRAKLYLVRSNDVADQNKVRSCIKMGFRTESDCIQEQLEIYTYDENAPAREEKQASAPVASTDVFAGNGDYPLEYGEDIEIDQYVVFNSAKIENIFKINQNFNSNFRFMPERSLFRQRKDGQRSLTKYYLQGTFGGGVFELTSPLFSEKPQIRSYRFILIDKVVKLLFFYDNAYFELAKIVDIAKLPDRDIQNEPQNSSMPVAQKAYGLDYTDRTTGIPMIENVIFKGQKFEGREYLEGKSQKYVATNPSTVTITSFVYESDCRDVEGQRRIDAETAFASDNGLNFKRKIVRLTVPERFRGKADQYYHYYKIKLYADGVLKLEVYERADVNSDNYTLVDRARVRIENE